MAWTVAAPVGQTTSGTGLKQTGSAPGARSPTIAIATAIKVSTIAVPKSMFVKLRSRERARRSSLPVAWNVATTRSRSDGVSSA